MNFGVSPNTVAVGSSHFGGHIPLSIGNVKYLWIDARTCREGEDQLRRETIELVCSV